MHFGKACEKLGLDFSPPAMVIKRATSGEENFKPKVPIIVYLMAG